MSEKIVIKANETMNSKFNKISIIFLKQIQIIGSWEFYLLLSLSFFLFLKIEVFLFLILGFILIHIIGIPIRLIFYKDRPKKIKYKNIFEKIKASSFPSFHSSRSMFLLLVFTHYSIDTYLLVLGIVIIALINYSRIYFRWHDLKDIITGLFLAIFCYIFLIWMWYNIFTYL